MFVYCLIQCCSTSSLFPVLISDISLGLVSPRAPVLDRTNWVASLTLLFVLLLYPALVVALVCFMLWRDAQWKMSTPVLAGFGTSLVLVLVFLIVVAATFQPWQVRMLACIGGVGFVLERGRDREGRLIL